MVGGDQVRTDPASLDGKDERAEILAVKRFKSFDHAVMLRTTRHYRL
jgi:hypothetical protein